MLPQVGGLTKGLTADDTDVRFDAQMHVLVSAQTAGVFEGFGAPVALVRALAGMLPQMILVVRAPFEGERAVKTLKSS